MTTLYLTYIFILGLILGSFYNVIGLRVPMGKSIIKPYSHCPICKRTLTAVDLIPFFSYVLLRGKCRGCNSLISPIYPIIELCTAFLFTISPLVVGWSKELLISWALISLLMIIFVSDTHYMIIPDNVLLFFGVLFIMLRVAVIPVDPWWNIVVGPVVGFSLLLLISIISKGGMGGGDIKLFAVLGIVLGWKGVLLAFFCSTVFGVIIGGIGLLQGSVKKGKPLPFGPAIVLGALTVYYFGQEIIAWYLHLI
jgi:leader peptidase (prepilin peptidase)/N-methyltransferase